MLKIAFVSTYFTKNSNKSVVIKVTVGSQLSALVFRLLQDIKKKKSFSFEKVKFHTDGLNPKNATVLFSTCLSPL